MPIKQFFTILSNLAQIIYKISRRVISILLQAIFFFLASSVLLAEVYDLGGMYTYHYRDGRYANWGDFALQGAQLAIDEINNSKMLGNDALRMSHENIIDYHCWPENAGLMADTLMKKSNILVITGADCSGPAVKISEMANIHRIPVISNGANASNLSSIKDHKVA